MEVNVTDDEQYPIEIVLASGINRFTRRAAIELEDFLRNKNRELAINNKAKR